MFNAMSNIVEMKMLKKTLIVPLALVFAISVSLLAANLPGTAPALAQEAKPDRPQNLAVSVALHDSVTLTWDDPEDTSITGYRILRRNSTERAKFKVIQRNTGSSATSYVDTTVTPETKYAYQVRAINAAGVSKKSRYTAIVVPASPQLVLDDAPAEPEPEPSLPTALATTEPTRGTVSLSWSAPEGGAAVTGYQVWRAPLSSYNWKQIGTTSGTSYSDSNVEPETTYLYKVRAYNSSGNGAFSGTDLITTDVQTSGAPGTPSF